MQTRKHKKRQNRLKNEIRTDTSTIVVVEKSLSSKYGFPGKKQRVARGVVKRANDR
jgi:hypothetical protein